MTIPWVKWLKELLVCCGCVSLSVVVGGLFSLPVLWSLLIGASASLAIQWLTPVEP